jgi:hypothetical protein
VEQRKHWFNGNWGRTARRDIKIYNDGDVWYVEARQGGGEGRSRWWQPPTEDAVLDLVRDLMSDHDGWRELGAAR